MCFPFFGVKYIDFILDKIFLNLLSLKHERNIFINVNVQNMKNDTSNSF